MSRKSARAAAVQMVFENMLGGDGGEDTLQGLIAFTPEEGDTAFIDQVLSGVDEHVFEIDDMIEQNLKGWALSRIAKVDQAVLRVAIWEMCYDRTTPDAVVINEAVTLAQRFNTPGAGKFVNGVLSAVLEARNRQGEKA
ncbi:MAG: transcription antitermination factor NusB [Clostridia bacterium]|nr:transcription antitermination factor NusB [Clostridia bacterium]